MVNVIFGLEDDDSMWKCLKYHKIDDLYDFIVQTKKVIEGLNYIEDDKSIHALESGRKGLIKCFIDYYQCRQDTVTPIGDDWMQTTPDEFQKFCVSPECRVKFASREPSENMTPPTSTKVKTADPTHSFTKTIKRDISLFPTFKH